MVCSVMLTKIDRPSRSMKLKQDEVKMLCLSAAQKVCIGQECKYCVLTSWIESSYSAKF